MAYAIGQRFYRPFIQLSYPVTTDQLLDHDHHDHGSVVGDIVINGYIKILDTFSDTFNLIAQRYVGDSVVVVVPLATKLIVLVDCGSHIARILELWCSELADSRIAGILLHTSLCMLSFLGFQMGLVNQALTVVGISCVMTLTNAVSIYLK
ncbi:hypothetical protein H4219_002576 [Mycoemilia scoparia]|uniref:Uncharacterized protein n=1 Tax=Mycoemilia scoparia TaxID=417184 RepID=A0A9W8DUL0_9FUNG|nr:hypothetical protein H4219_002576 [Mycoemilia scoparia]